MRELTVKYNGTCAKCGNALEIGKQAMYEKSMGIFCIGCEPKETEEIRHFRQIKADVKADKYETWANKRIVKAESTLNYNREHFTSDIAFNTQPGHIPIRARVIRQDDKALESLQIADKMQNKADNLRHVVVKGDAAAKRQLQRDFNDTWVKVGMDVQTWICGARKILKINKTTYTVNSNYGNGAFKIEKSFITKLE